ncbi:MAG: hypothetical protein EZS28_050777, partial [Streblomastix strix]
MHQHSIKCNSSFSQSVKRNCELNNSRFLHRTSCTRIQWESDQRLHSSSYIRFIDELVDLYIRRQLITGFHSFRTGQRSRRKAGRTSYLNYLKIKGETRVVDGNAS